MRFLLVATRNLLENVKFDLPPTKREPLGLTVRFLRVTMRFLLVLRVAATPHHLQLLTARFIKNG